MSSRGKVRSRTERKAPLARRDSRWCLSHEVGAKAIEALGHGSRQRAVRDPGPPGRDHLSRRGPVRGHSPSASISPWRSSNPCRASSCAAGSSGLTTAEPAARWGSPRLTAAAVPRDSFATRSRPRWLTVVRGVHWPDIRLPTLVGRPIAPERQPQSCASSPYCEAVDFSVLGPLRVEDANGPIEIRGGKERLLLARLVAASGRLVTTSDLIDTMWHDDPPASAAKSVQTFVLRLRNALEPDRRGTPTLLLTEGPGYRLAVAPGQVDAERFTHLAAIGHDALADGRPESAGRTLTEALSLWRGPAYAGFDADFASAEARRLEEMRLAATEDRVAADLALGRAAAAVPGWSGWSGSTRTESACGRCLSVPSTAPDGRGTPSAPTNGLGCCSPTGRCWSRIRSQVCSGTCTRPRPHPGPADNKEHPPAELQPRRTVLGRHGEMERLRAAWRRAVRGRPGTIVVRARRAAGAVPGLCPGRGGRQGRGRGPVRRAGYRRLCWRQPRRGYVAPRRPAFTPGRRPRSGPGGRDARRPAESHLADVTQDAEVVDLRPLGLRDVREIVSDYVTPDVVTTVAER